MGIDSSTTHTTLSEIQTAPLPPIDCITAYQGLKGKTGQQMAGRWVGRAEEEGAEGEREEGREEGEARGEGQVGERGEEQEEGRVGT